MPKTMRMHHYGRERIRLCQPHCPRHIACPHLHHAGALRAVRWCVNPLELCGLAPVLACSAGPCVPFPLPLGSCFVAKDPLHPSPVVKDDVQHPAQHVVGPLDEPRGPHLGPRMLPVPDRLVAQRQRL